ncbi:cytochrome P450, partial [Kibdelosporangium lantanae]
ADQGRTSGIVTLGVLATLLGTTPGELGTTTFRAPSVPVSFALMAGRDRGKLADPVRTTPIHPWHVAAGAEFENVGQWKRPWYYPRVGEDMKAAVLRECHAARTGVGMQDASTLGKIEVVGPDAGEFLNRMYTNGFKKLAVGSARYGIMCRADGMVFDDGVTMRLAPDRYYVTTTTGGAAAVLEWFEEWSQTEWPSLDVTFTSVTEQWSTIAVVGPKSRDVLAKLCDVSDFPFMTFRSVTLSNGVAARVARISFSGELAYEVNVAGWYGLSTWELIHAAGAEFGITPYGTETMHVLRAEKGFPIVGQDTDGTVTPYARMVIDETLRLYTPAWQTMRHAIDEDVIGGYRVPAGSDMYINMYVLHRHPDFWDRPEVFDPDRFTPDQVAARPRHAYVPFG